MNERVTVLLVDDQLDFVNGLSRLLLAEFKDLEVLTAESGKSGIALQEKTEVHLLITDLQMPEMNGLQLMAEVNRLHPATKVIILTGYGTIEKAVEAVRQGAFDFLTKPVASEQLYRTVGKAIDFIRLEWENQRLREMLAGGGQDNLLGESSVMRQVRQSIEAVAGTDYPVLIQGESGTGKELASRMVHRLSTRAQRAYIAINCPAIPDSLLESELFGHCRGAFTGADRDKEGLFSAANHGTLHLDEIGDISPTMQTKILRFLQEGEVRPVGSTRTLKTNVRIIASTNQPLAKKVEENSFRSDLYYRLNVIAITMPPLRDRVEDIALLARYFFEKTLGEMNIQGMTIEPEVLSYLSTRDWPGNVRELHNYVRRLVVFSGRENIDMIAVQRIDSPDQPYSILEDELGPYKTMKALVADRFSRVYIEQLLTATSGNVSEASRISGLSRVAIGKLSQRLGIDLGRFR
ncbi:sigma-54-dependent Fis family transcriptional regulator [Desulfopila sp. IMCC35006]|uniref:sigma-54-dependent transcriptional regulator n=1 Tax=Desulfopila sp. IMCC35006 TaxID=2569542 RepID=UPI0010AD2A41|nr:sigma-54 dependent transcriptional regulator [Desulfopila sp. IMCC35006]TKB28574.1 sigma-54-dependent Fis family transcriptional regulator [Desulfopila sp. IMCC35006]